MKSSSWKTELRRMKLESIKAKAPGFFELSGGYEMKIKPYNDNTANGLTSAIIDWITFCGGTATRINTQGQVRKEKIQLAFGNVREIMRYTPSTTRKGTADIMGVMKGRHLSIEVKIGKDRLSEAQLAEQSRIINAGGLYYVATDMIRFVTWFNETFYKNTEMVITIK